MTFTELTVPSRCCFLNVASCEEAWRSCSYVATPKERPPTRAELPELGQGVAGKLGSALACGRCRANGAQREGGPHFEERLHRDVKVVTVALDADRVHILLGLCHT
jgi:hypothetical protein